jgi:PAS domain S-box-containing protein
MKSLPNILIVDDSELYLISIKNIICEFEVNLILALSGAEALEKIRGIELALAIIDVQMPEMNGYELAMNINEEKSCCKVPIIFLSFFEINQIELFKGYSSGAVDFLSKSVENSILLRKINVFLELFNQRQAIIKDAAILNKTTSELVRVNAAKKNSEEIFSNVFYLNPSACWLTDIDTGKFIAVNKAFYVLFGFYKNEVISKTLENLDIIDHESINARFLDLGFNSRIVDFEVNLKAKNGDIKRVLLSSENIVIQDQKYRFTVVHDITERKLAEESLLFKNVILRTQQNLSTDGILVMNEKGEIISYNQRFVDMWNFPLDITASSSDEFTIQWMINKLAYPEEFANKENYLYEVRDEVCKDEVLLKDARIFERYSAPMLNDGEYFGRVWYFRDVTERNMAESTLRISEEKYKTIVNASPDGILLTDLNGIISEVSVIGFELFGAENRDDLIGKKIFRFVHDIKNSNIRELVEKTIDEGLVQNIELKLNKINHAFFTAETSATLIQSSVGEPLSFIIIIRDISQRKKMETKQIHADQMANLGEMASGMAHEINQPLNIISMVMDKLLFDSAKTETIDLEFLKNKSDIIFENIFRIRNIIDHVKAFSRSHDDYVLTAFDVNASIENAISMIKEQFNYVGIKLILQLDKQIPQIFGNTYAFEQVIVNLLVNAKDAVIEKKSKQEEYSEMIIEIVSYQEHQFLIVEVIDNGIGINKDDINNILLPFYTTKDEGKGTGIGLSICYQIVKKMNGTIDIKSDRIQGTKIKLVLDTQKWEK